MTAGERDPDGLIRRAKQGNPDYDQHFLVDDRVVDRIPTYAESFDRSHVLEIGAGTGVLTDRLLQVSDHVTAVERDRDLADFLEREFRDDIEAGRLTVIEGDALSVDLPDYTCCISNLPYGVSSEVTFRLLPRGRPCVLMYQYEFAERMAAESGTSEYGRLSVAAQHYGDVELVEAVPRAAFDPQPRVESAIVRIMPRKPDYEVSDEAFFLDFVKALFTQRRKTVRNAIRNTAHISGLARADEFVETLDETVLRKRPGDLPPREFARLAELAVEFRGES